MGLSLKEPRKTGQASCPNCSQPIWKPADGTQRCRFCKTEFNATCFEPIRSNAYRPQNVEHVAQEQVTCANHPRNIANANCERCGSFICSLCEMKSEEISYCPGCFERLSKEGAFAAFKNTFPNYPGKAKAVFIIGLMTFFGWPITMFFSTTYAVQGLRDRRWRAEFGYTFQLWIWLLLGILQVAGLVVLIVALVA